LALQISSFVGPSEMARADRRVPFWAHKNLIAILKTTDENSRIRNRIR
jgi:hypothetical protein